MASDERFRHRAHGAMNMPTGRKAEEVRNSYVVVRKWKRGETGSYRTLQPLARTAQCSSIIAMRSLTRIKGPILNWDSWGGMTKTTRPHCRARTLLARSETCRLGE